MNKNIKCVVISPQGNTRSHWPVVYLLHGHSGSYAQWPSTAPQLTQDADAFGILFVCPDGGYDSWEAVRPAAGPTLAPPTPDDEVSAGRDGPTAPERPSTTAGVSVSWPSSRRIAGLAC